MKTDTRERPVYSSATAASFPKTYIFSCTSSIREELGPLCNICAVFIRLQPEKIHVPSSQQIGGHPHRKAQQSYLTYREYRRLKLSSPEEQRKQNMELSGYLKPDLITIFGFITSSVRPYLYSISLPNNYHQIRHFLL